MRVKICGNTSVEDALLAAEAGADAVGVVNVAGTSRYTSLEDAKRIFAALPIFVSKVVVARLDGLPTDKITAIVETGADCVQLHGEESVEFVAALREEIKSGIKIIKKIGVGRDRKKSLEEALAYEGVADAILLDTEVGTKVGAGAEEVGAGAEEIGGTGRVHDWTVSREIVERVGGEKVILAGGLNPGNVVKAVKVVKPYAVDVSSGVESRLRKKDAAKVKKFLEAVKC
ncbi:MAG: N-(5'-phosphoribosyl)anthranilate isomerase [Candidatus Methanophagaceae archaeon]|nr:MAG: N-(5'-phosphoribosyl)anthranilate isomerase [Methanophagales archaeon]HDN68332.1 phosphoribosylanthranilate isomerase [Methanomicrobia archaeon]